MTEKMHLGLFFYPTGHHLAGWRHPSAEADAGLSLKHYIHVAQTVERGKFDFIFLADSLGLRGTDYEALSGTAIRYISQFEPLTILSALAAVTDHVGLVATITTSYNEPYHVARKLASLDHISHGRAGWNVVTSSNETEAWNFGKDQHYEHVDRYVRAHEFVEVTKGLWDTWEDDAFLRDKESSRFFDPAKLHLLNHVGKNFSVRGPLNVARPPQGYPIIVQAGSSERGKQLAAETAEVIFTAQNEIKAGRAFYSDVKGRMARFGRKPSDLKIMPGFFPVVGNTREEAHAKYDALQALLPEAAGLNLLSTLLGDFDLTGYPLDGPLPDIPESNSGKSRPELLVAMARRENLTIRQLYGRMATARGHILAIGTPADIADVMEEWVTTGAADGFNIMPGYMPTAIEEFVDMVVPELQRRGIYRKEYEGTTLRESLGLARPANHYVAAAPAAAE